jgi:zinc transport system substrate-binding protein
MAIFLTAILGLSAISCSTENASTETSTDDTLIVAVSIAPLADFVENVGGDNVEVTVMVPPGYSPHTYEPTPHQMAKISQADIYVRVGAGLEFEEAWMDDMMAQNPDIYVIDCSVGITKIGNDTHIWNSPVNAMQMVENIYQGMIADDPVNADYYRLNKESYAGELEKLDSYIKETLAGFSNRNFLIYHPAFAYFARDYNLTQIAVEHQGKEPTPQVIQTCIDKATQYNLNFVFVAPQFATSYAQTVADETGGRIIYVDPLAANYIANMRSVAASIALELE